MAEKEVMQHVRRHLTGLADCLDNALRKVPVVADFVRGGCPPVDVYETPDALIVRAEMPGVAKDNVEVRLLPGMLSIRGKTEPSQYETYTCLARESAAREFCREVALPAAVDEEAETTALLENGVLTVRLKKLPQTAGKTISVELR